MWIKKSEVEELSDGIGRAIAGEEVDFRDNKEGAFSVLKNDINTLVRLNAEQTRTAGLERDRLAEYMADISHQLKTPIASMMIMTDLLESSPPEKQEEFVSNIKSCLTRMEWLAGTLLKMAKLDSGTVEFLPAELTASQILKAALQPLEILLELKNQRIELSEDAKLFCDLRWTAEALTNLLKNASEHSPEGSVITVSSGANPIYGWMSVTDRGEGIPREKYASVFNRFEYSQKESGYGIGLPLALAIMRGQDGDIGISPAKEGGTTLTIKIFRKVTKQSL